MKAIETQLFGYSFRSRTEARWAIFFQTLGLKWEYEPEGFDLGCGVRYLPDFRVLYPGRWKEESHWEWFEVKGDMSMITADEWVKMLKFDLQAGLTILDGQPDARCYVSPTEALFGFDETPQVKALPSLTKNEHFNTACRHKRMGCVLWSSKRRLWGDEHENVFDDGDGAIGGEALAEIRNAVQVARSYRFGHGGRA